MPETPNHGYNVPNAGAEDWHIPLNENFEQYDTDIEIRDEAANRSNYDPNQGAKFLETDTGLVYRGDGSAWVPTFAYGRYEPADDADDPGNIVFGHSANTVDSDLTGVTIAGGGGAGLPHKVTEKSGTIGGGTANIVNAAGGTIGGGNANKVGQYFSTVGGGQGNEAGKAHATVAGGLQNSAGYDATVGGGRDNEAKGSKSTIGGGYNNSADGPTSTVAGGDRCSAKGKHSTVGGGKFNSADADFAVVPGGFANRADAPYAFAVGHDANVEHANTFLWNDGTDGVESTAASQFLVNASGGVGFGTTAPDAPVDVASENNWDLDSNDGDLRVGDDQYRLAMGVATGGAGAGACNIRAKGGIEQLSLGAGTNGPTVKVNPDSVSVEGDLSVSGSKNFVQSVDTDDGEKDVYYSAVEAGTPHTEVSGVAELEDGRAEVDLPEHFSMVTDPDEPLMVQVTPHARERVHPQVTERSTHRIVVEEFEGSTGSYEVSYTVKGTREGFADEDVVRDPR
jgi:hypothetical protein